MHHYYSFFYFLLAACIYISQVLSGDWLDNAEFTVGSIYWLAIHHSIYSGQHWTVVLSEFI